LYGDVQNLLVDSIFNKEEFTRNIYFLIESARKSKISIFYTAIEMLPLKYESSSRLYTYNKLMAKMQRFMPEKRSVSCN